MGVAGQVSCRACGAAAAAGAVDVRRSILICTHCAAITDLSGASAGAPALPGLRALPAAPPGILVEEDGESLRFRWRSFRSQGVVLLVLSLAWIVVVQYWMGGMAVLQEQLPKRLVFAVPGLVGIYFSLARILNATVVRADARTLEVLHGPIPVRRGLRVPASDVEQLFTVSRRDLWGTHPELRVRLRGRGPVAFGRLDDPGPALFIERTLEAFLRLEDRVSAFEPVLPGAAPAKGDSRRIAAERKEGHACTACGGDLDLREVDRGTGTVRCGFCGALATLGSGALEAAPVSPFAGLAIPARFEADFHGGTLRVRWPWMTWSRLPYFLYIQGCVLFAALFLLCLLGVKFPRESPYAWIVFATAIAMALFFLYFSAAEYLNRSELTASGGEIRTRHGPIPWRRARVVAGSSIRRVKSEFYGAGKSRDRKGRTPFGYAVVALPREGDSPIVLAPSLSYEEAEFLADVVDRAYREPV